MNCIAPPLVYPTTSASVLVAFNRTARPGCAYVPGLAQTADSLFVVLARHAGSEHWAKLEQLGEGQQLPIELGGLRCAAGCAFRVRWANKHEATSSETDLIRTPPPATKPSSKVYALRLEFFVSPPLPPPVSTAAAAFAAGVANLLRMKSERATVAEVSASGRFLLLDLLEQDVHAYIKGKRLPEIMPLLRSHGGELNVSGHAFDAGFGVWAQAREAEGALSHSAVHSPQSAVLIKQICMCMQALAHPQRCSGPHPLCAVVRPRRSAAARSRRRAAVPAASALRSHCSPWRSLPCSTGRVRLRGSGYASTRGATGRAWRAPGRGRQLRGRTTPPGGRKGVTSCSN
jgi:hypothetical protein